MLIKNLLPIVVFLLLPSLCLAESKISSKDSAYCEQNSINIISCLISKQGDTKTPLNKAYDKVYKTISYDNSLQIALEKSQIEWVKLRNEQCSLEAEIYGRQADQYLIEQTCLNYLNKQRTLYLNSVETAN
jgi:uncharacterized protein YecT (DUF1311 family)